MADALPDAADPGLSGSEVWTAYRDQFATYSHGATANRVRYQVTRIVSLTAAAAVTVCCGSVGAPVGHRLARRAHRGARGSATAVPVARELDRLPPGGGDHAAACDRLRLGVAPYDSTDSNDRLSRLALLRRDVALRESGGWGGRMRSAGSAGDPGAP